jgi:HSP20 family protein
MNDLIRFTPMTGLHGLQREVDRLFNDFFATGAGRDGQAPSSVWSPVMDLAETEDAFEIRLDLPGLKRDEVEITFENGALRIAGERSEERAAEGRRFHRVERWHGRFFRTLQLGPNVDAERIRASFEDGVLTIHVPKPEKVRPRRIEIGAGTNANGSKE